MVCPILGTRVEVRTFYSLFRVAGFWLFPVLGVSRTVFWIIPSQGSYYHPDPQEDRIAARRLQERLYENDTHIRFGMVSGPLSGFGSGMGRGWTWGSRAVMETALDHTAGNPTEAAYPHSYLIVLRRGSMEKWSEVLAGYAAK